MGFECLWFEGLLVWEFVALQVFRGLGFRSGYCGCFEFVAPRYHYGCASWLTDADGFCGDRPQGSGSVGLGTLSTQS